MGLESLNNLLHLYALKRMHGRAGVQKGQTDAIQFCLAVVCLLKDTFS